MKATDLMLGDWVRHKNGNLFRVTCLKGEDFACGMPHLWNYNNKFEPIPLTPEILEKNGFDGVFKKTYQLDLPEGKYERIYVSYWKGRLSLRYSPDVRQKHSTNEIRINCKEVHELQHALRLCGIEKEIVL